MSPKQIQAAKERWRRALRAERQTLLRQGRFPLAEDFSRQGESMWQEAGAPEVAAYYPLPYEPDLRPLLQALPRVLLPRLRGSAGEHLPPGTWSWWDPQGPLDLPAGRALPQAPADVPGNLEEVGLVFVPALAVDRSGNRLGQGGGWYDRALAPLPKSALVAAVVPSCHVFAAGKLPAGPHDRRVGAIITESSVIYLPAAPVYP